jgi:hypothetical protein
LEVEPKQAFYSVNVVVDNNAQHARQTYTNQVSMTATTRMAIGIQCTSQKDRGKRNPFFHTQLQLLDPPKGQ